MKKFTLAVLAVVLFSTVPVCAQHFVSHSAAIDREDYRGVPEYICTQCLGKEVREAYLRAYNEKEPFDYLKRGYDSKTGNVQKPIYSTEGKKVYQAPNGDCRTKNSAMFNSIARLYRMVCRTSS